MLITSTMGMVVEALVFGKQVRTDFLNVVVQIYYRSVWEADG